MKPSYIKFLIQKIKEKRRDVIGFPFYRNVASRPIKSGTKKALLIYVTKPFRDKKKSSLAPIHQNLKQCGQIISLLDNRGYAVDLLDVNDTRHILEDKYDLVISNRGYFNHKIDQFNSFKNIFLATAVNYHLHNQQVRLRNDNLFNRRGIRLNPRNLYPEDLSFAIQASAILCFGNNYIKRTWQEIIPSPCFNFNNYGYAETPYIEYNQKAKTARHNFLFFGSTNQVGKGLDLLLDYFARNPHLHLYVCGFFEFELDFCHAYSKELYQTSNIHPVGWVHVNSPKFFELCSTCAFIIHPSCSEGSPGSVIQCMHTGLIPIVSEQSGIDIDNFGLLIPGDQVQSIENIVEQTTTMSTQLLSQMSCLTRQISMEQFSEESFIRRWNFILDENLQY